MASGSLEQEHERGVGFPSGDPWRALGDLLGRASEAGIYQHALGALASKRLRDEGLPVPAEFEREERAASLMSTLAAPLLERARQSCDGPLLVVKGVEVARRYPTGGRAFGDVDLLSPSALAARDSLVAGGFVVEDNELEAPHHLKPLSWPALPVKPDLHHGVKWPQSLRPPPLAEIIEAGVPSATGVEGILAPCAAHHALILAAHSWEHQPLRLVRDLLDVALISAETDPHEIAHAASRWGIGRVWATTTAAVDSLFYGGRSTVPLATWARNLPEVRDRTVFELHLNRVASPFWGLPLLPAVRESGCALLADLRPRPEETWRGKAGRTLAAARHLGMSEGRHHSLRSSGAGALAQHVEPGRSRSDRGGLP